MRDQLLTRHFLQRFLENDLISPDADRHETLAVICAALISASLFVTVLLALKYLFQPFQSPGRTAVVALDDRFLYIACSMIVMGLVAVATWDALSLDGRDTAILGPLPVPRGAIVRAKLTAVALFSAGFAFALNLLPSLLHPSLMIAELPVGLTEAATLTFAHAAVTMAAGAFGFLSVLGARELLRAALGPALFERISGFVQGSLVVGLSTLFLLLPGLSSGVARSWLATGALSPYTVPPLWFLGLQETLSGGAIDRLPRGELPAWILRLETEATAVYRSQHAVFRELAAVAVVALAVAMVTTVAAYAWNSRKLPAPGAGRRTGRGRLSAALSRGVLRVVVRRPAAQAGFFFTLHSLSRSAPHRVTMTTSMAVGLAAAAMCLRGVEVSPAVASSMPVSVLAVQTLLIGALLAGFRHAIRLPAELRANWTFHLSWPQDERRYVVGVKRAAFAALVLPPLIVLFPLHMAFIGPRAALAHFGCGLLIGMLVVDLLLLGLRHVPFASAYVPGGNLKSLGPIYVVVFLAATYAFASIERLALGSTQGTEIFLGALLALVLASRAIDSRRRTPLLVQIDEPSAVTAQRLGLDK